MTTDTKHEVLLEDVLNDLALTSEKPDARVLGEYIRRYPEYTEEIIAFAAELAAMAQADEIDEDVEPSRAARRRRR